jgi:hypothetical protein
LSRFLTTISPTAFTAADIAAALLQSFAVAAAGSSAAKAMGGSMRSAALLDQSGNLATELYCTA